MERVETVKKLGISAFTVGTAAFDQSFPSSKPWGRWTGRMHSKKMRNDENLYSMFYIL